MSRGILVLAGSGEFTPAMDAVDAALLDTLRPRARVAIVPTAAGLEDTPPEWIAKGTEHFRALGADPFGVPVLNRDDANDPRWSDAIADADWIYFSGGDPAHITSSLDGTRFWSAVLARNRAGAILAGSSGGAMVMGEHTFVFSGRDADGFPTGFSVRRAMGVVRDVIIAPHFDIIPERVIREWSGVMPAGQRLLGIDEDTALVQHDGSWDVRGRGRVLLFASIGEPVVYPSSARVEALTLGALP
ncbi:MAG TPA: Type 1 glutamine amidotransferase-like domain-containing protein [Candidatus Limnocylindria bacterium]|nr:Type 1 glutamine amidotransferase-like domain-containing protein [Candidatus Limnocylindria bacterium]